MPTVLRVGPYRFFFYSSDRSEPMHVHVEREKARAKVWLSPLRAAWNRGFPPKELNRVLMIVKQNADKIAQEWNNEFGE
jgi:hypothetical protein